MTEGNERKTIELKVWGTKRIDRIIEDLKLLEKEEKL